MDGQRGSVSPSPKKQSESEFDTVQTLMRLVIGGAAEGADEVMRRLKDRHEELSRTAETRVTISPDETELDRLRYALIGLMVQTPEAMSNGFSAIEQASGKANRWVSKVMGPIANSRLMRPVQRRYDEMVSQGCGAGRRRRPVRHRVDAR